MTGGGELDRGEEAGGGEVRWESAGGGGGRLDPSRPPAVCIGRSV